MDPNVILNKILRLARLDTTVFDEVRDDVNELIPAMIVAAVSALLAGLGATLSSSCSSTATTSRRMSGLTPSSSAGSSWRRCTSSGC